MIEKLFAILVAAAKTVNHHNQHGGEYNSHKLNEFARVFQGLETFDWLAPVSVPVTDGMTGIQQHFFEEYAKDICLTVRHGGRTALFTYV